MELWERIFAILLIGGVITWIVLLAKHQYNNNTLFRTHRKTPYMKETKRADSREKLSLKKLTIKPKIIDRVYSQRITEKTETELFLPFARRFGGNRHSAKKIKKYIIERVGENEFSRGDLCVSDKQIVFTYDFECHSFFDDGGGRYEYKRMTIEPIEESDKQVHSEDDATSIVKDPFGLKGRFKITYCSDSGNTD